MLSLPQKNENEIAYSYRELYAERGIMFPPHTKAGDAFWVWMKKRFPLEGGHETYPPDLDIIEMRVAFNVGYKIGSQTNKTILYPESYSDVADAFCAGHEAGLQYNLKNQQS